MGLYNVYVRMPFFFFHFIHSIERQAIAAIPRFVNHCFNRINISEAFVTSAKSKKVILNIYIFTARPLNIMNNMLHVYPPNLQFIKVE